MWLEPEDVMLSKTSQKDNYFKISLLYRSPKSKMVTTKDWEGGVRWRLGKHWFMKTNIQSTGSIKS